MKNLRINKDKIISLLLAGTISLSTCGCAKQVKEKKEDIPEVIPGEIVETVYNEFDGITIDSSLLNDGEYTVISKNKENKIIMDTYLYDGSGQAISHINVDDVCNVVDCARLYEYCSENRFFKFGGLGWNLA